MAKKNEKLVCWARVYTHSGHIISTMEKMRNPLKGAIEYEDCPETRRLIIKTKVDIEKLQESLFELQLVMDKKLC